MPSPQRSILQSLRQNVWGSRRKWVAHPFSRTRLGVLENLLREDHVFVRGPSHLISTSDARRAMARAPMHSPTFTNFVALCLQARHHGGAQAHNRMPYCIFLLEKHSAGIYVPAAFSDFFQPPTAVVRDVTTCNKRKVPTFVHF